MRNAIFLIVFSFYQFCLLCTTSFEQCGYPTESPILSKSRIVGGYPARKHSWPWIVSIRQMDIHQPLTDPGVAICGGTLLNEQYVLTAAHCFYDIKQFLLSNYFIVVGAHYINDTNPIRFKIKTVILHEKYDHDLFVNDLALIELSHKVDLNDSTIGFICLPSNKLSRYPYEDMRGFAAGWGRLSENGSASYILQQIQLPIISNNNPFCIAQISDSTSQFCAGFIQGGRDTCQGDSGGPFMIYDINTSTWHIAGITSYGIGCARAENPGVYTRVSVYIDWIDKHVNRSPRPSITELSIKILLCLFYIILYF